MERFELEQSVDERLIDLIDAGVFVIDRELRIRGWNAFMVSHSGRGRREVMGRSIFDVFPELPDDWLRKKIARVFALGSPSFTSWEQRPWVFRLPHNRPITGGVDCMQQNCRFIPLKDGQGAVGHVLVCVFDVTDAAVLQRRLAETVSALEVERSEQQVLIGRLAEAQEQLVQSEKLAAIGQLAAGVAHEINNPIGFVTSNVRSLERYLEGLLALVELYDRHADLLPPEVCEAIARRKAEIDYDFLAEDAGGLVAESRDGLERVKRIVSDLRDFSRVGETEWQWADVHGCLDSTLNVVMNEIKYKAEVVKDYGDLPHIECMPFQLNQVFLNLMVNAAQAIDGRGRITLRTRVEGDAVTVQVTDTGGGMSPEVIKRIFDPFFTTKPVGKGTGLGLSVTHSIVARHRGHISVVSSPGEGTTFTVRLPRQQSAQACP